MVRTALRAGIVLPQRWWWWNYRDDDDEPSEEDPDLARKMSIVIAFLSAFYILLAAVAIVQLVRIRMRAPQLSWTTQKVFLTLTLTMACLRSVFFILLQFLEDGFFQTSAHYPLFAVFADLPSLIFFSTYTLLILFYAEIINQASGQSPSHNRRLRSVFVTVNALVYMMQVIIWLLVPTLGEQDDDMRILLIKIDGAFYAVIAILAALGFLVYGTRLYIMLRQYPDTSPTRHRKLREVAWVTTISTVCFSARAVLTFLSIFPSDVEEGWAYVFSYYFFTEIFPTLLVVFILRKMPPKSPQGQPVRPRKAGSRGDTRAGAVSPALYTDATSIQDAEAVDHSPSYGSLSSSSRTAGSMDASAPLLHAS